MALTGPPPSASRANGARFVDDAEPSAPSADACRPDWMRLQMERSDRAVHSRRLRWRAAATCIPDLMSTPSTAARLSSHALPYDIMGSPSTRLIILIDMLLLATIHPMQYASRSMEGAESRGVWLDLRVADLTRSPNPIK